MMGSVDVDQVPICGAPCPHGGIESTRRRSPSDLGWQGHCNQAVPRAGERCWRHRDPDAALPIRAPLIVGTCSLADCEHPIHSKARRAGLCDRHYFQKLKGRPFTPHPAATPEGRLWQRVVKAEPDTCWEYQGARDRSGYGQISCDGKQHKAHRVAWESANGQPVPAGMLICHRCDNPPCCNPAHLFPGTALDNNRDRHAKGRSNHASKLQEADVREIRRLYAEGWKQVDLAARFGVSDSNIEFIVHRKNWKHVA